MMKRTIHNLIAVTVFLGVAAVAVAQIQTPQRSGPGRGNTGQVGPRAKGGQQGLISALPFEELSEAEVASLMHMREEEKLARDTYLALYDMWELPVFLNIASSEQRHMDSVGVLIEKYGLFDPALDKEAGDFTDPDLQSLYETLVDTGAVSPEDALLVGARIEDLDIYDLKEALATVVDNRDIQIVFQNLLNGSMNHLRAFLGLLSDSEVEFEPEFLSPEEVDEIINSTRARGGNGTRNRLSGECGSETGSGDCECRRRGGPNN